MRKHCSAGEARPGRVIKRAAVQTGRPADGTARLRVRTSHRATGHDRRLDEECGRVFHGKPSQPLGSDLPQTRRREHQSGNRLQIARGSRGVFVVKGSEAAERTLRERWEKGRSLASVKISMAAVLTSKVGLRPNWPAGKGQKTSPLLVGSAIDEMVRSTPWLLTCSTWSGVMRSKCRHC